MTTFKKGNRGNALHGILLITLFSLSAFCHHQIITPPSTERTAPVM